MKPTRVLAPLFVFVAVIGAWETSCRGGWISPFLAAPPSAVVESLIHDRAELFSAFFRTTLSAAAGFGLSALAGLGWAIVLISSTLLFEAFYPYAVVFQTVPIIAVAPILVIWFGYGTPTVVSAAALASIFPVIMTSLAGFQSTPHELRDLFRLYRASWPATLGKLIIPMALPGILAGLRVAAGLAVIGAIVGEFVGGGGLGSVIDAARTQQRVDKVFAAVFLASALGAVAVASIDIVNRFYQRRRIG